MQCSSQVFECRAFSVFTLARASGLPVRNYQDLIPINQAGLRFYDETQSDYPANNYGTQRPYTPGNYLNSVNIKYSPANFINAALGGSDQNYPEPKVQKQK